MTKIKFIFLLIGSLFADIAAMWLFFAHPVVWTVGVTALAVAACLYFTRK